MPYLYFIGPWHQDYNVWAASTRKASINIFIYCWNQINNWHWLKFELEIGIGITIGQWKNALKLIPEWILANIHNNYNFDPLPDWDLD